MSAPAPVPRLHRARHRMRIWLLAIAAVVVVAVLITAIVGGFGDRPVQRLGAAKADTPIDTGEITVEIRDARVETTGAAIRYPSDDRRYLVVEAVAENHTEAPVLASRVSVLVRGATVDFDQHPESLVRLADASSAGDLQPELPTRIAWLWPLEGGAEVSDGTLDAVVIAQPRKLGDPVYGDAGYDPFEAIARIALPVRVRR